MMISTIPQENDTLLKRARFAIEDRGKDATILIQYCGSIRSTAGARLYPGGPQGAIRERHGNSTAVEFKAQDVIQAIEKLSCEPHIKMRIKK